jgi:deoxyribonuclease V
MAHFHRIALASFIEPGCQTRITAASPRQSIDENRSASGMIAGQYLTFYDTRLTMLLALDVHYRHDHAITAALAFADWGADVPAATYISRLIGVPDYEPGAFYKRELPCLLGLLGEYRLQPTHLVIDGYVDLDEAGRPGLGRHLYDALGRKVAVIGVAKTSFAGIADRCAIYRSASARPLYVTCAGVELAWAQAQILSMHGAHRIPTLLKMVDQQCRTAED